MSTRPICGSDTPDPWMISANGRFYLTFTCGNRVEIWSSPSLENFEGCQRSTVWLPPGGSPWSADVWAPELHYINESWWIYVSGARPGQGNPSHRTLVLRSANPDPMEPSSWQFIGPLQGMPDHWAIDATVFRLQNQLFCSFSGWPPGDHSDTEQDLFLIRMETPEGADLGTLVCISKPNLDWERLDNRGINEGPQFLSTPQFTGIVYSACGSWTNKYKLGVLQLTGSDPLKAESWTKWKRPLMQSDPQARQGPYGPGHASFVHSPTDASIFCIYHATGRPDDGWNNRKAHVCTMGPETFTQRQTIMCGVMPTQPHGQAGFPGGPQPQVTDQQHGGQGHRGLFDKVKDKLREL